MADGTPTTPLAQAYRAYERFEGQLSAAMDQLVATNGFADLLATSATTVMALTRLANGTVDRFVRSTRLAARQDVTQLARQLARTEDKLERLLQAVEDLQGRLDAAQQEAAQQEAMDGGALGWPEESEQPEGDRPGSRPQARVNGRVARSRPTAAARRRRPDERTEGEGPS